MRLFICYNLTSVTIPNGVTCIGSHAFAYCRNLTSVSIPNGVTCISDYAFTGCLNLTTVTIPNGTTTIGQWAFFNCGITHISIPDSVTSIGAHAFHLCENLTSVKLPNCIECIETSLFSNCENLVNITIPESVVQIGENAFLSCKSLQDINLPNNLKIISKSAFANCIGLNSIVIPASVESIEELAFNICTGLTSVSIPNGILNIGRQAFAGCSKLTHFDWPASVTEIGDWEFASNGSMASISIPASVTSIRDYAFDSCYKLSDIYYEGTKEQWDRITLGSHNTPLTKATIHFNSTGPDDNPYVKSGTFSYLSYDNNIREYNYVYDESCFFNSSYEYQHDLTKMSLRVAMAAGDARAAGESDGARTIKELMNSLEFTYSEEYSHYPESEYDSIGYGIGSKEITSPAGEKSTLIMVAIRGSGYGLEWGGNFRIGTEIDHEGFTLAANQVIQGLENYIEANRDKFHSNIKVWISGYSRAAATTNLVARYLDNYQINGVRPQNVYAFCFECPQNTISSLTGNSLYANIVNVINPIDFVPKVAMSVWDYNRFGSTYCLPSYESTANYPVLMSNMRTHYRNIVSYAPDSVKNTIADEAVGQASILDTFFENLAWRIGTPEIYCADYQEDVIGIAANFLGGGTANPSYKKVVETVISLAVLHPTNTGSALGLFLTIDGKDITSSNQISELLKGGINVNGRAARSHYMELSLAWLDSLDDLTLGSYNSYRKAFINCPVNVTVRDNSGRIVAQITDNMVQEIESGLIAYLDSNGQKVIILPTDEAYDIQLTATDSGTVTYTITEFDVNSGRTQQVVSYCEVAITNGDELHGTIENLENGSTAKYPLALTNGKLAIPTIDQTGDEVVTYTVKTASSDGGTAIGGGTFINGEYAKVIATPKNNYRFDGWYIEGSLVSVDAEYRFLVNSDTVVTAKFTESPCSHVLTYIEAVASTCKDTGIKAHWRCSVCGKNFSDETATTELTDITTPIDPTNHVGGTEVHDAKEATFEVEGYTGDTYCLGCGSKIADGTVIPKKTHSYSNGDSSGASAYAITIDSNKHGDVIVSPGSAAQGGTVTITVKADTGYQLDKLTVTDKNGSEIKLTDQGDGTYTFTMPASSVSISASFAALEAPASVLPFTDVTTSDWFYDAVAYVYDNGLMTGTSATTFSPNATTTRGMIVTILHRLEGSPAADASGFADVESGAWYQEAVDWAAANGIVNGTSQTTFAPTSPITREQMAAILYRYAAYKGYDVSQLADLSRFSDSSAVSTYAADALAWANAAGLITGVTDTTLSPQGSAVRAQAATILMRFCENIAQ